MSKKNRYIRISGFFLLGFMLIGFVVCASKDTLSQETQDALKEALMDEYKAEATYAKIIEKFGEIEPFLSIIKAETKHSVSLEKMYTNYSLDIPKNPWKEDNSSLPDFDSVKAACAGGVEGEIANIAIYDRWMKIELPDDIKTVFTRLRDASKEKHLPAFQNCAK